MESWCSWQLPDYHKGSHSEGETVTEGKHSPIEIVHCWSKLGLKLVLSLDYPVTRGPIHSLYCLNQFVYLLHAPERTLKCFPKVRQCQQSASLAF